MISILNAHVWSPWVCSIDTAKAIPMNVAEVGLTHLSIDTARLAPSE